MPAFGASPTSAQLALGERDRLIEHGKIADVVGEDQHEPGVEVRRGFVAQSAPRVDERLVGGVGIGECER